MISSNLLQNVIDGVKEITGREFSVSDREGFPVVATSEKAPEISAPDAADFVDSLAETFSAGGSLFVKVTENEHVSYLVGIDGNDDIARKYASLAAFQLQSLCTVYRDGNDRESFMKTLLMDNMLLVDIYSKAQKLKIENNLARVVYFIEVQSENNLAVTEVLHNLYPTGEEDFLTSVDAKHIILVKDVSEDSTRGAIEKTAHTLEEMISAEVMESVRISIGSVVRDIKDIPRSYKEAKMAMEVGKIFYEDRYVVNYNWLGIGRLIYQLPDSLCRRFIDEIFTDFKITDLDEEMLTTVSKFFQNSLNISETSRQLYVHRNTLVYRLDKLQKNTGLDIRVFEDAITFRIALMVSKYMNYLEQQEN